MLSRSFREIAQAMTAPANMTAAIQPNANVKPKISPSEMLRQTRDTVEIIWIAPF
jgi:hypothetical protein